MKNNKDVDSLSHTTWRCQYHVVFAPKYRRMVIYGQIKKDIGQILRKLCEQKDIEIIEAEACPDHIHMLISFSPKYSISYVMGYLKGKSSLMIFDRHANLKYKYGNRHFWARGYFVDLTWSAFSISSKPAVIARVWSIWFMLLLPAFMVPTRRFRTAQMIRWIILFHFMQPPRNLMS